MRRSNDANVIFKRTDRLRNEKAKFLFFIDAFHDGGGNRRKRRPDLPDGIADDRDSVPLSDAKRRRLLLRLKKSPIDSLFSLTSFIIILFGLFAHLSQSSLTADFSSFHALSLFAASSETESSETTGGDASIGVSSESDQTEAVDDASDRKLVGNIPMKWIPDQKILPGAPETVISLTDVIERFEEEGAFGREDIQPDDVEISIIQNAKKEVVTPVIDHDRLHLVWDGSKSGSTDVTLQFRYKDYPPVFDRFKVEVWAPNFFMMSLVVLGGLGIFVYGMKNMSDGVQRLTGPSLRRMIALFTEHRIFAFAVGILITMLLQSSSVTTVMVIGFVNSQIVTLSQAIGVILGANIGTTITGWILTLNVAAYSLPLIGFSSLFYIFSKNETVRSFSCALMGFGFLFFGLKLMGDGFSSLQELPEFSKFLQMFAVTSFFGLIKCVMAGCALTVVIQSSSAAIGIVMSLALIGAIDFTTAVGFVLGENIGTTITAVLASIGTSVNARRAAAFHVIFNMTGVIWVLLVFHPIFIPTVQWIAHVDGPQRAPFGIAVAHSLFNITNALLFLPFTRTFARLLTRFIPEGKKTPKSAATVTGLVPRYMETPAFAIERSRIEVQRMSVGCRELGLWIQSLVDNGFDDEKLIQQSFRQEETLDHMQDEIIDFTSEMLSKNLTTELADSAREQLRIADELESISDYLIAILKSDLKLKNDGLDIPSDIRDGFRDLHQKTLIQFGEIQKAYAARRRDHLFLDSIYSSCRTLTIQIKELRSRFLTAMTEERFDPLIIVAVNSQLNFYRRLWEHQQNIVEAFCTVR